MESEHENGVMWQQIGEIVSHADCHDLVDTVLKVREYIDKLGDKCLEAAERGEDYGPSWVFLAETGTKLYGARLNLPKPSAGDVDAWRLYGAELVGWLWVMNKVRSDWVHKVMDKI